MPSDASLRERGVVLLAFVLAAILAATLAGVMPHTGEPGHVAAPNPESYTLAGGAWPILDSAALLPQYAFAQVSPDSTYFVTTWMTYGINESVTIPVRSGLTYNYTVIWGDGTNSTGLTGDAVHKYATAGDHQVRIYGTYPQIYLNGHVDASSRLVSIDQWGSNQWVSMHSAFQGASDMTYTATDTPDLSAVTTMRDMFLGAASFDGDLSSWNVSGVTDMRLMFRGATSFDGDISDWDVSGVARMGAMFQDADSFDGDLSSWNVSGVTDMSYMFYRTDSFDGDLSDWDVSGVIDMASMFQNADSFNGDISSWNVSGVTSMSHMFSDADSFNGDLSSWNVSGVDRMDFMFTRATSFNQNLGNWYIVLDETAIDLADAGNTIGSISAQNLVLASHNFTYGLGSDSGSQKFAISGNDLQVKPGEDYSSGTYDVTITVTGAELFGTNNQRTVSVTVADTTSSDTTPPVIELAGLATLTIEAGTAYNDQGATCTDTFDGAITPTPTGEVDTSTPGDYTIAYSCVDAAGNRADPVSRTVTVEAAPASDNTPPTLRLTGSASTAITVGASYTDAGATCEDAVDGTITPTSSGTVDASQAGTYTLTYSCRDAAGNSAPDVSRDVIVEAAPASDNTPPTLRLTGSASTAITVGASYTDAGATCEDAVDGTITPTSSGTVDASHAGTYILTYSCQDAAGNSAPDVSRDVIVEAAPVSDTTPPILRLTGSASTAITVGASYTDAGATCEDAVDGTITPTSSGTVDASHAGTYILTYSCQDAAGNSAPDVSRDVIVEAAPVSDTTPPTLRLTGSASTAITVGASYTDAGATCEDAVDGTITPTSSGTVDASHAGTYILTYSCQDAAGNSAPDVSRDVIVEAAPVSDTTPPTLALIGPDPETITVGAPYTDAGATCTDTVDGTITPTSSGTVDASQAGTYTLTYSCRDAAGNDAPGVSRTVTVSAAVINTGQNPPTFVSSTLNNATGVLAITFSEDIDVTPAANVVPTKIHVRESGSYTGGITLSAGELATAVDGTVISFTLTAQHLAAVKGLAVPELTIEPGAVKDTSGDLIVGTFDVSTAAFVDAFSVSTQDPNPRGMAFSSDGTKMFVAGFASSSVYEYTLSAPFDISAPVIAGDFSVSTQDSSPTDVALSNDGAKMFVVGYFNEKIYEYTLTTAFSVSSATFASDTSVSQDFYPDGMAFSNDGAKMFMVGDEKNSIYEYALSTAFDVSTAVFADSTFSVTAQETSPTGMAFSSDGTKMFVVGINGIKVNEYTLSAPFDISTPIFVGNFSVSFQDTNPEDLAFSSDGAKMFIVGNAGNDISEYALSSVYPITVTASVASDTAPPTISLVGPNPAPITVGTSYTDAGATCTDTVDGAITPTSSGTVDASQAGTYTVTYSCQDAAGNSAPDVSRGVIVEAAPVSDTTPPTLALIGPDPETITVGAPYTDAGATCTDTVDGAITPTSSGTVDASQAGTYTLTYSCRDAAGNDAPGVSRTVTVSAAVINTGQNPPTFVSSTLNNATGVLAITFSEDIDVTPAANVVPTKIHVRESGSYTGGITLSAGELATAVDGTVISFTLTAQHLAAVKGLAVPELTIEPGAVKDTSGDLIVGTFDVSTAAFVDAFSVSTQDPNPRGMAFSSDGTKMFVAGFASSSVYEYTLSAPFDISAPVIAGDFSVSTQDSSPTDVALSNDGAKMFVVGYFNEKIYEYTLTTAFSVSSATFASDTSVSQDFYPDGMAFSNDGAKMFMVGDEKNSIYEYALSTAFDVSTAVFADSTFSVTAQETSPTGMAFSSDGTKMFVVGINGIKVNEYTLSAPFDISTPIFVGNFSVSFQDTNPEDLAFSSDGAKMFIVGNAGNDISEYALSSVYPITVTAEAAPVVPDTTAPVITLAGPASVTITVGATYDDEGAACTDDVDASLAPTVSTDTVDAGTAGTYAVTYACADAAGNQADPVSRTVIVEAAPVVPDTTAPVITLEGPASVTITVGATYDDEGAACTDDVDASLAPTVSTDTVDAGTAGTYAVTYACADAAGNQADPVSRTVIVEAAPVVPDTTAPVITLAGPASVTITVGATYDDEGAACTDDVDASLAPTVSTDTVDAGTAGTYAVTYACADAAGNQADPVSRTVIVEAAPVVPDTTAPVITLAGPASVTITVGATYDDEGAACTDDVDASLAPTVSTDTVDAGTAGTYAVTYACADAAGNQADPVSRTVIVEAAPVVPDTTAPVITLAGPASVTITVGATYDDEGAACTDDVDASLAPTVSTDTVDAGTAGTYAVTYACADAAGNQADPVSRTVIVEAAPVVPDTTAPVITLAGPASVTITVGATYDDEGAACTDDVDASLAPTVSTDTVDAGTAGTYAVTYACADAAGNQADPVSRTVIVEAAPVVPDTTAPVITLAGPASVTITVGATYDDEGAACTDDVDASLAPTVSTDTVDAGTAGTYAVTYACADAAGNQADPVSRTVIVEAAPVVPDTTAPVITLAGPASVTITVGATYDDEGAACTDDVDASLAPTVSTDTVDAGTAGTYAVTYACADAAGNQADPVSRTVIVEAAPVVPDTTAPVITLAGPASVTITVGATYDDEGAACTDDVDGTIEPTSTDNVDTSQAGTYTLTYSCQDAAGNDATPVEREVIVSAAVINTGQNPPTFVSSTLNNATGVLAVTFSEDIDVTPAANVVPAKIHVRESGSYTGGITLSAGELATAVDGTVISFTLTAQHLAAVNGLAVPELTIEPGAVKDTSGDLIVGTFDVSTATFTDTVFSVSPQDSDPRGMAFSSDGTKMFVVDYDSANVNEYTLSAPFDISAPVIAGDFSVSTQDSSPTDVALSNDGTKMFVVGQDSEKIYEYALSAPFDLSTATFANDTSVSQYFYPDGMAFSNDGTKMFVVGYYSNAKINEYALTAPFDISTATFTDTVFSVSSQETFPSGMAFSSDGTKMFVVGIGGMKVNEYALSAPFDISTPIFVDNFSVSSQDTYPEDLAFSSDGAKMFIVGYDGSDINEYTLSSVYPITVTVTVIPYVPDLAPVRV